MQRLVVATALIAALLARTASAAPGTEFVLILDNSSSLVMNTPTDDGKKLPPTDPDRMAILATLLVKNLVAKEDRLTILAFPEGKPETWGGKTAVNVDPDDQAIREMWQLSGTYFKGPFEEARRILSTSDKSRRVLVLFTDGIPSDIVQPKDARQVLGLDPGPAPFDVISIAVPVGEPSFDEQQRRYLDATAGGIGEYHVAKDPVQLVTEFTTAYARTLRSKPQSGSLQPNGAFAFDVPEYVSEVLVSLASEKRQGAFETKLDTDRGTAKPAAQGDNGCSLQHGNVVLKPVPENPNYCKAPFHYFQVYKEPHDPKRASRWTLSLPSSRSPVSYGIILKYDLVADVVKAPTGARVGETVEVAARLTFQGKTFDDEKFFAADGFKATAVLGTKEVELERQKDNTFTARVEANEQGRIPLKVRFQNRWLDLSASAPDVVVEGWLPLSLKVNPNPLDFGAWTGSDVAKPTCVDVDLTGSVGINQVPIEFVTDALPEGLLLAPKGGGEAAPVLAVKPDKANKVSVCLVSPKCCTKANLTAAGPGGLKLRGTHPHYHPEALSVPVVANIAATPFYVCWWKEIAGLLGMIALVIIGYGVVSPHEFDREEVIRMAKGEQALARAVARRLNELPGGKRGFYRDARCAFDGTGNAINDPKGALLALRAKKGDPFVLVRGTLEKKDPRTRQWVAVPANEINDAVRRGQVYRIGEFYFRIG